MLIFYSIIFFIIGLSAVFGITEDWPIMSIAMYAFIATLICIIYFIFERKEKNGVNKDKDN